LKERKKFQLNLLFRIEKEIYTKLKLKNPKILKSRYDIYPFNINKSRSKKIFERDQPT